MKFSAAAVLSATAVVATATATNGTSPKAGTQYQLKITLSDTPALKDTFLTVFDESDARDNYFNPIGSFSSGNPRYPYTFTAELSVPEDNLYALKSVVKKTHLISSGNPIALALYETKIGADPAPQQGEKQYADRFLFLNKDDKMFLVQAEAFRSGSGSVMGPGTWRACLGDSQADYQIYWFDGLHDLRTVVQNCETIEILVVEAASPASPTQSGFITGVPAPSKTSSLTGVPAPTNATNPAKPTTTPFEGAATHLGIASAAFSIMFCVLAFIF